MNNQELLKKLSIITSELLKEKDYIAFVDVFMKLGYLDLKDYEAWRNRKISCLEKAIKVNLSKISFIMKSVIKNNRNGKLKESWTCYNSWGKGKEKLFFSKSRKGTIEKAYATHFLKPKKIVTS
jgi:hypothetical protein